MAGNSWLVLSVIIFIVSLVFQNVPLLLVSLLFFLAGGASRLWNRYCLERVEYRRELSASRAFFGEEVKLKIEVANRKILPLAWLEIEDELPQEVALARGRVAPSDKVGRNVLQNLLSVGWYQKITRHYTLRCENRGYFFFGPTRLSSGDMFGFFRRETDVAATSYLMVYPRVLPLEAPGIPSKQPLGDIRTRAHLFHDPILTLGVREFQHGDSLRHIHWKSTARSAMLQTKIFEPTTTLDVGIFLDVRTMPLPYWGLIPDLLELAIVTSASLANHAIGQGCRVGFYANQYRRRLREFIKLAPSQHPDQLRSILEALAQVHPLEAMPVARLVQRESRMLPWGSTLLVVSAAPSDALLSSLVAMKRAGRRVGLVVVGGLRPQAIGQQLPVYHVSADVSWRDIEAVTLENA